MLILPIKKKWFDMILSGEKKEEYREIKPYYTTRFINMMYGFKVRLADEFIRGIQDNLRKSDEKRKCYFVRFRNGYSSNSPTFEAKIVLSIGTGKEEWGAEKGVEYYILHILEINT